jgi:hypothetical protein
VILYLLGAVLAGFALLILGRAFWIRAGLTWARVALALAIAGVTFGVIVLAVTGKISWLFAAIAGLVAFGSRLLSLLSVLPVLNKLFPNWHRRFRRGGPGAHARTNGGDYATIETPELRMTLHHGSGHMDGEILFGAERGRFLSELDGRRLATVLAAMQDPESKRLLTAYLERLHGGAYTTQEPPAQSGMSREQALDVLGLRDGALREEIVTAHRRLIQKLHPDRGGSSYLAAQLNEAKRVLLGD